MSQEEKDEKKTDVAPVKKPNPGAFKKKAPPTVTEQPKTVTLPVLPIDADDEKPVDALVSTATVDRAERTHVMPEMPRPGLVAVAPTPVVEKPVVVNVQPERVSVYDVITGPGWATAVIGDKAYSTQHGPLVRRLAKSPDCWLLAVPCVGGMKVWFEEDGGPGGETLGDGSVWK